MNITMFICGDGKTPLEELWAERLCADEYARWELEQDLSYLPQEEVIIEPEIVDYAVALDCLPVEIHDDTQMDSDGRI